MNATSSGDLLLAVDFQNVYLPNAPWACPGMCQAEEQLCRLLDAQVIEHTIFTVFEAAQRPVGTWQSYNREYASINRDPFLNELTDRLKPYAKKNPVYSKSAYSSWVIPEVQEAVRSADRVLLTGVVAECCILSTLLSLIDAGAEVLYLTDCISGQNKENEEMVRTIAASFSPIHVRIMTSEEYLMERNNTI